MPRTYPPQRLQELSLCHVFSSDFAQILYQNCGLPTLLQNSPMLTNHEGVVCTEEFMLRGHSISNLHSQPLSTKSMSNDKCQNARSQWTPNTTDCTLSLFKSIESEKLCHFCNLSSWQQPKAQSQILTFIR